MSHEGGEKESSFRTQQASLTIEYEHILFRESGNATSPAFAIEELYLQAIGRKDLDNCTNISDFDVRITGRFEYRHNVEHLWLPYLIHRSGSVP
jgi:hypothetical protein